MICQSQSRNRRELTRKESEARRQAPSPALSRDDSARGGGGGADPSARLSAGLGAHTATAGPHGCASAAAKSAATGAAQGYAQSAAAGDAPMPTRTEERTTGPVRGLGE